MKKTKAKSRSASSRPAVQRSVKNKPITRNSIRVVTANELKSDAKARGRIKREVARLAKSDSIDFSDAPQLPAPAWENPIRGMDAWLKTVHAGVYKPVKQAVSMRLDADVVAWLKQSGPGYQTRANRILREKMMKELAS